MGRTGISEQEPRPSRAGGAPSTSPPRKMFFLLEEAQARHLVSGVRSSRREPCDFFYQPKGSPPASEARQYRTARPGSKQTQLPQLGCPPASAVPLAQVVLPAPCEVVPGIRAPPTDSNRACRCTAIETVAAIPLFGSASGEGNSPSFSGQLQRAGFGPLEQARICRASVVRPIFEVENGPGVMRV